MRALARGRQDFPSLTEKYDIFAAILLACDDFILFYKFIRQTRKKNIDKIGGN
jgi:hypothetical protein